MRADGHRRRGFTLIEVLVVLAIVAGILAMSVMSFSGLRSAKLRAEAMRMSGALRMVYGRSAVNSLRYEVALDLDGESYSVSCSAENVLIEAPADDDGRRDDPPDPEADPFGLGARAPTLEDCSEPLLPATTLRGSVEIARVLTAHDEAPVESGTATVAYFPDGFVERTLIWLRDGEAYLTLSIDPMSGRVRVIPGDFEVPDDFFEVEED